MSEQLKEFYKAYVDWLDAGAPHAEPFERNRGLCHSLGEFLACDYDLIEEMQQQFTCAGLNWEYPFDKDWVSYRNDANKYLNKDRVAWVRKHAEIH